MTKLGDLYGFGNLGNLSAALSLSSDNREGDYMSGDKLGGIVGGTLDATLPAMMRDLQRRVQAKESWPEWANFFKLRSFLPTNATNDESQHRYPSNVGEAAARITETQRYLDDAKHRLRYPLDVTPNFRLSDLWGGWGEIQ